MFIIANKSQLSSNDIREFGVKTTGPRLKRCKIFTLVPNLKKIHMARIIPSDLAAIEYSNSHSGEIEILRRLQKELPNEFTVFHSLHWSNERPSYTVIGEIDFVIINQSGSILIIEQKNGVLEETEEGLVKHYGRSSKNVAGQVHRSRWCNVFSVNS